MPEILGTARTVSELLKGRKYSIDYFQREYEWQEKQVRELIEDLTASFLDDYEPEHSRLKVKDYGHYFLGSIIISSKNGASFLVDGQQRLTTLTLLLLFLRGLQRDRDDAVALDDLIYSQKYGAKSFNLEVEERIPCMEALFEHHAFDATDGSESVRNLVARYEDIQALFPDELRGHALPYFIDWLTENVHLVEITAYSDEDAYTIFETMNDRGLSLTPTEMLKGYVLSKISQEKHREQANAFWKAQVLKLSDYGKEAGADFFKAWLRSQYAAKIRERSRGAAPEDFDRIATEFHRWFREGADSIGVRADEDFYRFIERDFGFFSRHYLTLLDASRRLVPGLETVLYNAQHGFTLQYMVLLAPLLPDDPDDIVRKKIDLTARFVDILLARRIWNSRSIAYSTMQYAMFLVMRDIRRLGVEALATKLRENLDQEELTFGAVKDRVLLHQQNRYYVHRLLARITSYVEEQSGDPPRYLEYVAESGSNRYEVEHIWADKFERHTDEFSHPADFADYRNRVGDLLLLPKSFNAAYGALPYDEKLPHYFGQNLLAKSLNPKCYELNPGFVRFVQEYNLPFHAHSAFKKADIDERGMLYYRLAEQIGTQTDCFALLE